MYTYLDNHDELYFIEYKINGTYVEIGDVTFSEIDLPIVIGKKVQTIKGYSYRLDLDQ